MKKRVEELLAGRLKDDGSKLELSVGEIRASVPEGSTHTGSFTVCADDGTEVRSFVISDCGRVQLNREKFAAKRVNVMYQVNTEGLKGGDEIHAKILFLSHIGRYVLPVHISIASAGLTEAYGNIRSLDDFARMAENDFREAFRMFNGSRFHLLLSDAGEDLKTLYRGLSQNPVTYQHLEEFLIAAGRKEKIGISLEKEFYEFYISEDQREQIVLKKNTWGHTDIDVEVCGDFIRLDKTHFTEEDFLGNTLNLEFILVKERVRARTKKGKLTITTPYETKEVRIEVASTVDEVSPFVYRQSQIASLFRLYIRLKQNRLNYRTWYETSLGIADEMAEEDEGGFALFAHMFLCYSKEDYRSLIELLWKVKSGKIKYDRPWERAAYLYFSKYAGLLPVEERNISAKLAQCYRREPTDYIPLAFYLKDSENDNPARNLETLEKAYDAGCCSPLLYLDGWNLIRRRESLLRRLSPYILHMLYYVGRNGMITKSVLMRAAFLIAGSSGFDRKTYVFLKNGYDRFPGRELLEVICKYIMNGNPERPEYFKWFSLAVQEGLRMTRLYEYYMVTRPANDRSDLPLPVKIYFSYSPVLGENKRAYLYSLIIEHKNEDPVTFENYDVTMREFAVESLSAGRINENYAVLYREYFSDSEDADVLKALAGIIFTGRTECADGKIRAVSVCSPVTEDENVFRFADGRAWPRIYTPDSRLVLEDGSRRRYVMGVPFTNTMLFPDRRTFAEKALAAGISTTGLRIYFCFDPEAKKELNGHTLLMYWTAAEDPHVSRRCRDILRGKILKFLCDNTRIEAAAPFVEKMKGMTYAQIDKAAVVELFLKFGRLDDAYGIVRKTGCENIPLLTLSKLLAAVIKNAGYEEDEGLVYDALYAFKAGSADSVILDYLCRYVITDPGEMDDIRQKAVNAGIDTMAIEERLILFMIYIKRNTRHAKEIFDHYRKNGGQTPLCRAYLTFLGLKTAESGTKERNDA